MAGSQTQIDFAQLDSEARAAFVERNNELRSKLRSIDVSLTGLSSRPWKQVIELVMSVWVHTTTKSKQSDGTATPIPVERLMATSGLTPRQFRATRTIALQLALLRSVRIYQRTKRIGDRLEVDVSGVDALVASSRVGFSFAQKPGCNPAATRFQPGCSDARIPRARVGAALELPITVTSTATTAEEKTAAVAEIDFQFGRLLRVCRKHRLPLPRLFREAFESALANGCSYEQIHNRCGWWHAHVAECPAEHRKGSLYDGLRLAMPDWTDSEGWPYR